MEGVDGKKEMHIMDYVTETDAERADRLARENSQLVAQLNLLERRLATVTQENGSMHAEMEQLAQQMHRLQLEVAENAVALNSSAAVQEDNAILRMQVCAHSNDCPDFDRCGTRTQVYLADD